MDQAPEKTPVITMDFASGRSSDSSSIVSATADHGDTGGKLPFLAYEAAKNKMKMKEEVGEIPGAADAGLLLDLNLATAGSSLHDPLSPSKVIVINESSSPDNSARDELPPANRVFMCVYCKKKFSSWQALGGHQNAHRVERLMVKRQKEMAAINGKGPPSTMTYGYDGFNAPYSNVRRYPAFRSLDRLALPGAGMDQPRVQVVQPSWSQPGFLVMQNGPWPGHPSMTPSPPPRMDCIPYRPTNFYNNFRNGGFMGQYRRLPPPAYNNPQQGGGGAMMHSFQLPSSIPSSSVPTRTVTNGGASSSSVGNHRALPGRRDDRSNTHHGELDLTLKL